MKSASLFLYDLTQQVPLLCGTVASHPGASCTRIESPPLVLQHLSANRLLSFRVVDPGESNPDCQDEQHGKPGEQCQDLAKPNLRLRSVPLPVLDGLGADVHQHDPLHQRQQDARPAKDGPRRPPAPPAVPEAPRGRPQGGQRGGPARHGQRVRARPLVQEAAHPDVQPAPEHETHRGLAALLADRPDDPHHHHAQEAHRRRQDSGQQRGRVRSPAAAVVRTTQRDRPAWPPPRLRLRPPQPPFAGERVGHQYRQDGEGGRQGQQPVLVDVGEAKVAADGARRGALLGEGGGRGDGDGEGHDHGGGVEGGERLVGALTAAVAVEHGEEHAQGKLDEVRRHHLWSVAV